MANLEGSNLHYDANEKQQVFAALDTLFNVLNPKAISLSTEERLRYGSVDEKNKKIINKVKDYHNFEPTSSAPEVDWREFLADYEDRNFLEFVLAKLNSLTYEVESTKIVHDHNNLTDARADYAYAKYREKMNIAGASQKSKDLAQFFAKTVKKKKPATTTKDPAATTTNNSSSSNNTTTNTTASNTNTTNSSNNATPTNNNTSV